MEESPEAYLNRCIKEGKRFRQGTYSDGSYSVRVITDKGPFCRLKNLRPALVIGIGLFIALIAYQSLFIWEVSVEGYRSLNQQQLMASLKEAGLYKGCRKNIDVTGVKLKMYEEYDNLSWIGITFEGSLARVTVAETDHNYEKYHVADEKPCNIVAGMSGYVESINPRQGIRAAEDGAFVEKGDVLISGTVPLQNVAYGTEDEDKTETYVHASGDCTLVVPERLVLYSPANRTVMEETGRKAAGISVNGTEWVLPLHTYETAKIKRVKIIDLEKPLALKLHLIFTEEVRVRQEKISENTLKEEALNQIHKFVKENLPEGTQILKNSLNFTREKNIIKGGVTIETLQKTGIEEEIIIDDSNRKSEKDDDQ